MRKKWAFLLVLCVVLSFGLMPKLWAKPTPPPELTKAFEDFGEIEEKFEDRAWNESIQATRELANKFDSMASSLTLVAGESIISEFKTLLRDLRMYLYKKNEEEAEETFITLQNLFFDLMNYYEYEVHPLIKIMRKYIVNECAEAAEKMDFDDVSSEMHEVESFYEKFKTIMTTKGASEADLNLFKQKLEEVKKSAESKNAEQMSSNLDELITIFKKITE